MNFTGSLAGKHVLITRPRDGGEQDGSLEATLRAWGARVSWIPTVTVRPLPFDLTAHLASPPDWLWFTSRNGVKSFFSAALPADWAAIPAGAVGPATAAALAEAGHGARFVSPVFDGESAARAFVGTHACHDLHLLWPCGDRAHAGPAAILEAAGARVTRLAVYETVLRTDWQPAETTVLQAGGFDMLVFTSPSGVEGLQAIGRTLGLDWSDVPAASMGPRTTRAIREILGQDPLAQAEPYTFEGLAQAIRQTLQPKA